MLSLKTTTARSVAKSSFILALIALAAGCVVETREGYWDRDHNRWYHDHAWHECGEGDSHCH